MNPIERSAVMAQIETLSHQANNAAVAIGNGDMTQLKKSLSIMGKVVEIVLVVLNAIESARGSAKAPRGR